MNVQALVEIAYLVSASLFIIGLHDLGSPITARRGNLRASTGMFIAIVVTLLNKSIIDYQIILLGLIIGSILGAIAAKKVKMTAMPQMVGLFNGFGGGASAIISVGEFWMSKEDFIPPYMLVTIVLGLFIGGITFSGSMIAFGKLQKIISLKPIKIPLHQYFSVSLFLSFLIGSGYLIMLRREPLIFLFLIGLSLVLGILFVIPIGGADMPVAIALLNSFSGIAASATGFVIMNNILIISGALVGASGIILTRIMSKAMNRSLKNILFGVFEDRGVSFKSEEKNVNSIGIEEAATMLVYARSLVIVPGYGMAAARAQHVVSEIAEQLEKRGVEVKFAIHPVAGRMPGHMNVLLAEAEVPYDKMYSMEEINPEFSRTDVVLVVGANDIVNPVARHDVNSPLYGMPILDVDKAHNIIVIKRSLNPGYAGIDNELFYKKNTMMLFGDAREVCTRLLNEIRQL